MNATTKRPVYLNLLKIKLPIAGIMSIIHRITGVVMVLATPLLVFLLDRSLSDAIGFAKVGAFFASGFGTLFLFLALWAVFHHLFAGIRYLLIDVDIGVEKPLFQQTALAVMVAAPVVAALMTGVLK